MAPGDDPTGPQREWSMSEWSIRQLTAATGTTSRTLRLQRILLLRELGMAQAEIREVLDAEPADHARPCVPTCAASRTSGSAWRG